MAKVFGISVFVLLLGTGSTAISPEFSLNKQVYASDETIKMSYDNVPFSETNWIGIWRYVDGPGSNKQDIQDGPWHQDQTTSSNVWQYIPAESGQFQVNARMLTPGRYAAFLLSTDGYMWLSNPVVFDIMDTDNIFKLKTLTFNIWHEGTSVSGGFDGIVNEIIASGADIVSLSEVRNYNGVDFTSRLVDALNTKGFKFHSYQSTKDVSVVSRFPITSYSDFDRFTKSNIDINNVTVAFYSSHLDYTHYAAYLPRGYDPNFSGKLDQPETRVDEILKANDESARPESINAFLNDARTELSNGNVVIMSGDLNEPSWLDWTNETKDMFDHNGAIVPWTSTKLLSDAGYQDAYRVKYPDPVTYPGFTWVSDNPDKDIEDLTWTPTADERDRIDFTFYYPDERLSVEDAIIIGPSTSIVRSQRVREAGSDKFKEPEGVWPSDHKAVLVTFKIMGLTVINPEFSLDKQVYSPGDSIKMSYANIPFSETNWIGIWRYVDGPGSNKQDIQDGPWHQNQTTSSNVSEYIPHESGQFRVDARKLTPGRYAAFILIADGYTWLSNPVIFDIVDTDNIIKLKTLTFNIWHEGTSVSGGFDGIVNEIIASGADIVSLSEVNNNNGVDFTRRLVDALNTKGFKFYSYQSTKDVSVVSRFPITSYSDFDRFTKSNIDINNVTVAFYSSHLDYTHYAAYLPRGYDPNFSGKLDQPETRVDEILKANDKSARPESINAFLNDARTELSNGNVVIMSGDLNEPSWLDWTNETKDMFDHNGAIVPWTSTKVLNDAGYQDAYRMKYPDPVTYPGFTWVSDNPDKDIEDLTWTPTADERDRIDFTFYYPDERLSVEDAIIIGPSTSIVRSQRVKETGSDKFKEPEGVWPSDHKAVLVTFKIGARVEESDTGINTGTYTVSSQYGTLVFGVVIAVIMGQIIDFR